MEGHELQALLGATQFLRDATIVYALMELRPNIYPNRHLWRNILSELKDKGLIPYRIDYDEGEKELDIDKLYEWKHFKHPDVLYYDVVWRLPDFTPLPDNWM